MELDRGSFEKFAQNQKIATRPKKHAKYIISSNSNKFHHISISLADVI